MADSASESDSSSVDGGMLIPSSPASREQFQKRIESLQQENRVLKMELDTFRLRVKNLQEENKALRQASVNIQAKAEQEEEFISNTLLKQIKTLKKEKETLALNYEQEEECLTNDLSRKLNQCLISVPLFEEGHCHKMQKSGDEAAGRDQKQTNSRESRNLGIRRCVLSLEHASLCRDADCSRLGCRKTKKVLLHYKTCKRRANGSCVICKQLILWITCHIKNCQKTKCPLLFCRNTKHNLKQLLIIRDHRIAKTQNCGMTEAIGQSSPGTSNRPSSESELLASPDVPQASACPQITANPRMSIHQGASANFEKLLASLDVSNSLPELCRVLRMMKSNPQLMSVSVKQRSGQVQLLLPQQHAINKRATIGSQPGTPQCLAAATHYQQLRQKLLTTKRQQYHQHLLDIKRTLHQKQQEHLRNKLDTQKKLAMQNQQQPGLFPMDTEHPCMPGSSRATSAHSSSNLQASIPSQQVHSPTTGELPPWTRASSFQQGQHQVPSPTFSPAPGWQEARGGWAPGMTNAHSDELCVFESEHCRSAAEPNQSRTRDNPDLDHLK